MALLIGLAELDTNLQDKHPHISYLPYRTTLDITKAANYAYKLVRGCLKTGDDQASDRRSDQRLWGCLAA